MGDDSRELLREVILAGQCSHPVRLRGNLVNLETGEIVDRKLKESKKGNLFVRHNLSPLLTPLLTQRSLVHGCPETCNCWAFNSPRSSKFGSIHFNC